MTDIGKFVKKLDLFRRIDEGYLVTATAHGASCSLLAYVLMVALTIFEFTEYISSDTTSTVVMDGNQDESLLIKFNITMLDLPCNFASVDVYDVFGVEKQNITSHIKKTRIHSFDGKFMEEIHLEKQTAVDTADAPKEDPAEIEVDEEGHHALDIRGEEGFNEELRSHDYTLMNFYAPWCKWCKLLTPIYEEAADEFDKIKFAHKIRSKFASLNCEKYAKVCEKFKIKAYPTLLIFNKDKPIYPVFSGERTSEALVNYLKKAVYDRETHMPNTFHDTACRIEGYLNVARVPGDFHVEARSTEHDLSPTMANLSHIVHHLQFGETLAPALVSKLPLKHQFLMRPLKGRKFIAEKVHSAPQHYIKVVTTLYEFRKEQQIKAYQLATQNRIANYPEDDIPEAKFSYDLSPISVIVSQRGKPFYSFLTSLFAIIGGTFTVISLLDGVVETVNVRLKRSLGKLN